MLIVDKLSLNLFFLLLIKRKRCREIVYLDPATRLQKSVIFFLKIYGISARELDFHLGDIERIRNSSLYLKGVRLADNLARQLSSKAINEYRLIKINEGIGRKSVQLSLAKFYQIQLMDFCLRLVFLQSCRDEYKYSLIERPYFLDLEYIKTFEGTERITFYSSPLAGLKGVLTALSRVIRITFRCLYIVTLSWFKRVDIPISCADNIILSLKEDPIHDHTDQRNQQFWSEGSSKSSVHYILDQSTRFTDFNSVSIYGITHRLPLYAVGFALRKHWRSSRLQRTPNVLIKEFFKSILNFDARACTAVLYLTLLFIKSREIGSLAIMLRANRYVFKETHGLESDAIQLVSDNIGLTTVGIQYSNLPVKNCLMDSTPDKFLIFSDLYKTMFSDKYFSPREFIVTGYPYRNVQNYVRSPAEKLRKELHNKGADLIIGYFDENVLSGKFSLTNRDHHYEEISQLAKLVLSNPSIAVVVKPQFTANTTEHLYHSDSLIKKAFDTGRLLDLCRGQDVRNRVYPAETGLICDICVGNMLGGTASLEVAVIGSRSAMINPYNVDAPWVNLLSDQNIMFGDLHDFLRATKNMNRDDLLTTDIGDWSSVVKNFDPFDDELSFKRIQEAILK
tara:strand:+ start:2199 stop:4061 length:1863 start_codon:yes stop_codon:yes gene_type:complete